MRFPIACFLIVAGSGLGFASAQAEVGTLPARGDVAGARPQPEFEPINVRLGAWTAAPEIVLNQGYDSNLFGASVNRAGDGYAVLTPSIKLASDWSRHGLDLSARTSLTRYAHHERQNSDEYALGVRTRLELSEANVTLSQSWDRTAERRGINGIPLSLDRPSVYRSSVQSIDITREKGIILADVGISHRSFSFSDVERSDGSITSQAFRDSHSWQVRAGVGAVPLPNLGVGLTVRYAHSKTPLVPDRDSDTIGIEASTAVDFGMVRTELAVAWLDHRFAGARFQDFQSLVYRQSVAWYPTTLITVHLQASMGLKDSGDPSTGAVIATSVSGGIDYELLRNFVIRVDYGWQRQKFREVSRRLVSRDFGVNGEYSFNRSVAFGAYARSQCRDSVGQITQRDFCARQIGVTLKLRR